MPSRKKQLLFGYTERGSPVGETHPRAKLTDHDCDLIRELAENNELTGEKGLSYSVIAEKFDCSKSTVRDIIKCRRRYQQPARWRHERVGKTITHNPEDTP